MSQKYHLAVYFTGVSADTMTECLRYMGKPNIVDVQDGWYYYRQPRGLMFHSWANNNIARMATFGVKAEKRLHSVSGG